MFRTFVNVFRVRLLQHLLSEGGGGARGGRYICFSSYLKHWFDVLRTKISFFVVPIKTNVFLSSRKKRREIQATSILDLSLFSFLAFVFCCACLLKCSTLRQPKCIERLHVQTTSLLFWPASRYDFAVMTYDRDAFSSQETIFKIQIRVFNGRERSRRSLASSSWEWNEAKEWNALYTRAERFVLSNSLNSFFFWQEKCVIVPR